MEPSNEYHKHSMTQSELQNLWFDLLDDCSDVARVIIAGRIVTRYSSDSKWPMLLLVNYACSHAKGMVAMGRAGEYAGIPVVARSLIECYINFRILVESERHEVYMVYASMKQDKAKFEKFKRSPNSLFVLETQRRLASENQSLDDALEKTKELMAFQEKLVPKKYKNGDGSVNTGIEKLFGLADQADEHDAVYRTLSAYTHGNLSAIAGSAFNTCEREWPLSGLRFSLGSIDSAVGLLIDQASKIANLYRLADATPLRAIANRRKDLLTKSGY